MQLSPFRAPNLFIVPFRLDLLVCLQSKMADKEFNKFFSNYTKLQARKIKVHESKETWIIK